jgi:pseudouridine synthase
MNKPRGVTCTVADRHAQQTVVELVDLPGKPALKPVGRLDANSEGLIFLSDDGDFIYRLTHPRYHVQKTYLVTVRGEPTQDALGRLLRGIELDDGRTAPADGVRLVRRFPDNDTTDIEIIIHEGRKRQVRRMCDAIGHSVLRLVRTRIGAVTMGGLPAGAWRHLTASEIERLIKPEDDASAIVDAAAPKSPAKRAVMPRRAPARGKRTPPSQKGRTEHHGK